MLIDTGFHDPYVYNKFMLLAQSVGFKPECKQFYDVTESMLHAYGTLILSLDGNFVLTYLSLQEAGKPITNPVVKKIVALIDALKNQKNKLIGIMLSPQLGDSAQNTYENAAKMVRLCCGLDVARDESFKTFLKDLMQSDSNKSSEYHTALLSKKNNAEGEKKEQYSPSIFNETAHTLVAGPLPLHHSIHSWPLAWYSAPSKNAHKNHIFITKTSLMLFGDIGENFIYNPVDFAVRTMRFAQVQQLLYELYQARLLGKFPRNSNCPKPPLPRHFSRDFLHTTKQRLNGEYSDEADPASYGWIVQEGIWCGWLSLDSYAHKEKSVAQSLLASHLNLLWLQLSPEFYLSTAGSKKSEKALFLKKIDRFMGALQEAAVQTQAKLPHIFMGMEISGNFAQRTVKNPVVDVYGKVYSKIPSPFDFNNLWQKEVLDVFDRFCAQWSKIGHTVPLAGVFFDFEMYHAQDQAAHYTTIMDFSDCAWNVYCTMSNQRSLKKIKKAEDRIGYLMDHKQCDDYFKCLKKQASLIGKKIKDHIRRKVPHALIAIYDIHPPYSWFYTGIMAGMSSKQEPLILATFNNDFYSHASWLEKQGVYAYHLPVLLLSKFKKCSDFKIIEDLVQFHDGIWFNKISRLEESRNPEEWERDYEVEVTPLETPEFMRQLRKTIMKVQK